MRTAGLFVAVSFGLACCSAPAAARPDASATRPNIILVMADDQGWGETGYHGHPQVKTPVLDEMARSGLRLDRFYAQSPNCSPTRASGCTGARITRAPVSALRFAAALPIGTEARLWPAARRDKAPLSSLPCP